MLTHTCAASLRPRATLPTCSTQGAGLARLNAPPESHGRCLSLSVLVGACVGLRFQSSRGMTTCPMVVSVCAGAGTRVWVCHDALDSGCIERIPSTERHHLPFTASFSDDVWTLEFNRQRGVLFFKRGWSSDGTACLYTFGNDVCVAWNLIARIQPHREPPMHPRALSANRTRQNTRGGKEEPARKLVCIKNTAKRHKRGGCISSDRNFRTTRTVI